MTSLHKSRKAYLSAKAVKHAAIYGTAEAVPFVRQSSPKPLMVSEGFAQIKPVSLRFNAARSLA
jgi:hypothetical protein